MGKSANKNAFLKINLPFRTIAASYYYEIIAKP